VTAIGEQQRAARRGPGLDARALAGFFALAYALSWSWVIPLAAGWDKFQQMLDGAWAMDCHFRDTPLRQNLPVLLGLVGIWNTNALGCATQCILAYDDRLRRLPAHLQQLEMESNGKHVTLSGAPTGWDTCPILFGEPGTNAQHSFMQLVHQGTRPVPVDFILAANADHDRPEAHRALAANAFAQAEALMRGKSEPEIRAEMAKAGAFFFQTCQNVAQRILARVTVSSI